jgi:5-methyltetrahydropteroyltriglutamate--homocysteine methyltransferase
MMVEAQLTGIFPRSDKLIKTTWDYEKGKIDKKILTQEIAQDAQAIIEMQTKAGIKYITDGMLLWQDLFRPFIENINGIKSGALTRWFNNNTFFRQPIIEGKIESEKNFLYKYIQTNLSPEKNWKAILPGPFTFAKLSVDKFYGDTEKLISQISKMIAKEVKMLSDAGISFIQFNEPAIVWFKPNREEFNLIKKAYEAVTENLKVKTCIHTYFGDATPALSFLSEYPVDYIGIDFYSTSLDDIEDFTSSKGLLCGSLDARNSLIEKPSDIASFIRDVEKRLAPKDIIVSPNCDLEFLPRSIAEKKIEVLGKVLNILR